MFFSATFVVSGYWITYIVLSLVGTSCTSLHGMARDLSSAERLGYPFICEMRYCRDSEINIDGLPDYRTGRCRGNRILLWLKGGKPKSVLLVHDKQMHFIVQYTEVSVLTWRTSAGTFLLLIWTFNQFSFYIVQSVNWRRRRMIVDIVSGMPCFPCYKVPHCDKFLNARRY